MAGPIGFGRRSGYSPDSVRSASSDPSGLGRPFVVRPAKEVDRYHRPATLWRSPNRLRPRRSAGKVRLFHLCCSMAPGGARVG
jgi:hypothetical protein